MESNWISVEDKNNIPPEQDLYVKDELGNIARAYPTYFPFIIEKLEGDERKPWGWRGTPVPCENHWDGGWMIVCENLSIPLSGKVKYWRYGE